MAQRPQLIILEGNISAGKTTLSRELGTLLNAKVFLEPTLTNPYLERFYADPKKYGLLMQIFLLRQRFRMYVAAVKYILQTGQSVLLDRSVYSDGVFAAKNVADGNITEAGYKAYLELRDGMLRGLPVPHVTVFLDVAPQTCYDRVHNMRGRACETGIPLAYLAGLHQCYLQFLDSMRTAGSTVLVFPWEQFGNACHVAQAVRAAPTPGIAEWVGNVQSLMALVYSTPALVRRMRLATPVCKSTGEVFDEELDMQPGCEQDFSAGMQCAEAAAEEEEEMMGDASDEENVQTPPREKKRNALALKQSLQQQENL